MKNENSLFKEIELELEKIHYSENGILDLINLINRAVSISENKDPVRKSNACLNNLIQTREKELNFLKRAAAPDREHLFNETVSNFKVDLRMFCN